MSLFKRKEKCDCTKGCRDSIEPTANQKNSTAKILGGGCARCNALEAATVQALTELGLDTAIEHIKDYTEIASYGVMTTPALVYNGKVLSYGQVLNADEVKKLIEKELHS